MFITWKEFSCYLKDNSKCDWLIFSSCSNTNWHFLHVHVQVDVDWAAIDTQYKSNKILKLSLELESLDFFN